MISLEDGVELVWHAFEDMLGGEIYVKKIPSMKVTDIASAIAPKASQEIIGIRLREKLHEQMVGIEDANYTYEYDNHFKILPAIHNSFADPNKIKDGKKVEEGFMYTSDNNNEWMSGIELQDWIELNSEHIGKNLVTIPYGRQNISKSDIDSVVKVLKSDLNTQGPVVNKFEEEISNYTNSKYAVASNIATSSLHIACLALGINKNDIVWTSAISFVASANCALYCGAKIDFIDIDKDSFNISIHHLEKKLIKAKQKNELPKALIAVHMCGQSCDMKRIFQLSKKYNFKIRGCISQLESYMGKQ